MAPYLVLWCSYNTDAMENNQQEIIREYLEFVGNREFPCVAAREAVARQQVACFVAGHMACPKDDADILAFMYNFVDSFRKKKDIYNSATIIFTAPGIQDENVFEKLMWNRLQAISDLDAMQYGYDSRVTPDPSNENFSFSLKEEAFFIIGMHPASSRPMRRFRYAALAFNPHAQFEQLREKRQYDKVKNVVRKRDLALSGSINPMLDDFGKSSEVYQYSGRQYEKSWQCPLNIHHGSNDHNSSPQRGSISTEKRTIPEGR